MSLAPVADRLDATRAASAAFRNLSRMALDRSDVTLPVRRAFSLLEPAMSADAALLAADDVVLGRLPPPQVHKHKREQLNQARNARTRLPTTE